MTQATRICVKLALMQRHKEITVAVKVNIFFEGSPWLFEQDSSSHCSALATTGWRHRHRVCVRLTSLPVIQMCLYLKIVWHII